MRKTTFHALDKEEEAAAAAPLACPVSFAFPSSLPVHDFFSLCHKEDGRKARHPQIETMDIIPVFTIRSAMPMCIRGIIEKKNISSLVQFAAAQIAVRAGANISAHTTVGVKSLSPAGVSVEYAHFAKVVCLTYVSKAGRWSAATVHPRLGSIHFPKPASK
jgi:hypothetical protein